MEILELIKYAPTKRKLKEILRLMLSLDASIPSTDNATENLMTFFFTARSL
jgi:hypothetical protein